MKHLYFVRHGESHVNIGGLWASKVDAELDSGLTEIGRHQAKDAGQKAKAEGFTCDLIITSPLLRASETAQIIADAIGYPRDDIHTLELLMEMQYGQLEGTSVQGFWEQYTYKDLHLFQDAETVEALQVRAQEVWEWLQNRPEDTILVVSHSAFGRALQRAVKKLPYTDEFTNGNTLPHAEIVQLI